MSEAFSADLSVDRGLIRETGREVPRRGKMHDFPFDIAIHILRPTADVPGGAGEPGVPANCAAAANSWARARAEPSVASPSMWGPRIAQGQSRRSRKRRQSC
jgi:hypothetical protein